MNKQLRPGKLLLAALGIVFIMLGAAGEAEALMIKLDQDELTESSDAIAYGTVVNTYSQWDEGRTGISTTVTFSVERGLKGSRKGETITIVVPGGEVDGIGQYVSDTPDFRPGEEAVLFLRELKQEKLPRRQIQTPLFAVNGNFQGKLVLPPAKKETTLRQLEESISASTADSKTAAEYPAAVEEEVVSGEGFAYNGMRWYGTSPVVPYKINATADRVNHIRDAAATWNRAGANFSFSYDGSHSRSGKAERNYVNEIMWYNLNSTQALAVATVWYSGDWILENDMVFNTMFNWSTTGYSYYDVQTVALHEFGHWLSLGHSPTYESIMFYQNKGIQRTLDSVDISGIRYIYGSAEAEVPVNDNFAARLILKGAAGQTTGTNVNASKETGEPNHAGVTGDASVWWEWVSPADGEVEFNTFNSSFDTLLAVYTGPSLTALQSRASNDDYGGTRQSMVNFQTTGGTAYKIAVAGWGASTGNIVLNWQFTPNPCTVTAPDQPEGPGSGTTGEQYTYTAAGGSCSNGHELQYRFDLGNGTITGWDLSPAVTANWTEPGDYSVRTQARCSVQTKQESPWSAERKVAIDDPVILYDLTVSIEGEGTTSPEPGTHTYDKGTSVDLYAEPADGWLFDHWLINGIIYEDAAQTVAIISDIGATAFFSAESNPEPQDPDPGDQNPPDPDPAPPPAPPSSPAPGPTPPASYVPTSSEMQSLTVNISGEGSTIPGSGTHSYKKGARVNLTAKPAEGWRFEKWVVEGIKYTETNIELEMDGDKTATAHFKIIARGDLNGDGAVNVTDVSLAARYSLRLADLTASQQSRADLNGDGRVNIIDISILTRYTLGLINELPAE